MASQRKTNNNNIRPEDLDTDPNEITKDLMTEAKSVKIDMSKDIRTINKEQFYEINRQISKYYGVAPHIALIALCLVLQAGGSSRNKKANVKLTLENVSYESKIINSYITTVLRGFTPRQFARYFADQIFEISREYDKPGNCYAYIARNYPELLQEENDKYWASDFQVDNPNCPLNVKSALGKRYADRFNKTRTK